jgi:hypothetical protein
VNEPNETPHVPPSGGDSSKPERSPTSSPSEVEGESTPNPKDDAYERLLTIRRETGIRPGQVWRHFKGGLYTVVGLSVDEWSLEPLVHYRSHAKGRVETRTLKNWFALIQVAPDAVPVTRYVRTPEAEPLNPVWLEERISPVHLAAAGTRPDVRPDQLFAAVHDFMTGNASDLAQAYARGLLDAFRLLDRISQVESEGWQLRFLRCPGHEGSNSWCAYCGDLDPETGDPVQPPGGGA